MKKEKLEKGKATPEQVEIWKKQYPEVYEINVEGHYCYLTGFDRTTMKFALSRLSIKVNPESAAAGKGVEINMEKMIEIGEIALQNCWLGGDDEIKTNDRLFIAAAMQVGELFDIAETSLKKL